jgi:hypothetical protein
LYSPKGGVGDNVLLGGGCVTKDVKVDKGKFDALLGAMLSTPPLPKSEVKAGKRKPKKKS